MPSKTFTCPECQQESKFLNYEISGRVAQGTFNLETKDHEDHEETSTEAETNYFCPECDYQLSFKEYLTLNS